MATVRGMLGQAAPPALSETNLYTCPTGKNAVVRVIATNRSLQTTMRVSVGIDGVSTADEQYVAYEQIITGNDAISTVTFAVGGDDIVRVFAKSANVSFSCTGIEQDD